MSVLDNPYSSELIHHFTPVHELLTEMSNVADECYIQGGMVWDFKYLHGCSHVAKLDDVYVSRREDFNAPTDLEIHTEPFAELMWRTGLSHPMRVQLDPWDVDYDGTLKKNINNFYGQASEVIATFKSVAGSKTFMSINHDDCWTEFNSVVVQGRNAIIHSAMWSID